MKSAARQSAPAKNSPERELALQVIAAAREIKAEGVMLFDLERQSSITDFVVLCSGRSQGHVRGIAGKIEERMKARGVRPMTIEGEAEGSWIVLDYGDAIAHVFHPETRLYYDLETLLKPFLREDFPDTDDLKGNDRASSS